VDQAYNVVNNGSVDEIRRQLVNAANKAFPELAEMAKQKELAWKIIVMSSNPDHYGCCASCPSSELTPEQAADRG